ncbi:MAG: hypothetical protein IT438_07670 [Phycisphaerales bacterium]|nr:hypothetical protein [Phycisphaerales bacterium]
MRSTLAILAALSAAPPAFAADAFNFSLNTATSAVSYNISASAPFAGDMTGNTAATPPTRLKHGTFRFGFPPGVNCSGWTPTTNEAIVVSGSVTASGASSNIRPTGTFQLALDTAANTATLQGLSLNLLGTSTATIAASLSNFRYENFCAVDPACELPFLIPLTLPLGNATVSALSVQQSPGAAAGTITPVAGSPNSWNFAFPAVEVTTNVTATFSGSPLPVAPQTLATPFTGTIVINGNTATITSTLDLNLTPDPVTTPTPLAPLPFTIPAGQQLCAGLNLILSMTINSSTFTNTSTANLVADGTRIACRCDWNNSGSVTIQDVFDFLTSYFGASADFNADTSTTVQDIFDFLTCFFARPLGC